MNRPIHFEILASDPGSLVPFYQSVFGWEMASWQGPQSYWLATTGQEPDPGIDGGFMERHLDQPVINTIGVEDLDAMMRKVEEAGGKLLMGPHDVEGVGRHAYCADPQGTIFGLMQFEGTPGGVV